MAKFKNLMPYPQQFRCEGETFIMNGFEVKDLPDFFKGKYGGLIIEVPDLSPKVETVPEPSLAAQGPAKTDDLNVPTIQEPEAEKVEVFEVDPVETAVQKADENLKKTVQSGNKKKAGKK